MYGFGSRSGCKCGVLRLGVYLSELGPPLNHTNKRYPYHFGITGQPSFKVLSCRTCVERLGLFG